MTEYRRPIDRRIALQPFVGVDGMTLAVEAAADTDIDQVNRIQPNGKRFRTRERGAGVEQLPFEFGTANLSGSGGVFGLGAGKTATGSRLSGDDLNPVEDGSDEVQFQRADRTRIPGGRPVNHGSRQFVTSSPPFAAAIPMAPARRIVTLETAVKATVPTKRGCPQYPASSNMSDCEATASGA